MKKIKYILLIIFSIFITTNVYADNLYKIDMNVYLNKDGSANITENWNVKADSGTEWYKALENMGNIELSDFKVSMDGKPLKNKKWNVDETLKEKKGYYGINYTYNGLELCFGKGDMKEHTFTLTYKLSNFIFKTEDADVLYATLFPKVTADNFSVTIKSYYDFPDTLDVWGYGYKGYAYVKDGIISMSNDDSLDEEYVVLLAKFPLNTFTTQNTYEEYKVFQDVLDTAEENTFEYDYEEDDNESFIGEELAEIFIYLVFVAISAIPIVAATRKKYGYKDNKKIDKKNINMFRDIPCNKDIYYANALINLNNFNYKEGNIFGAIILKWVKNNKIVFRNDRKTGIFNKETSSLDLTLKPTFDNNIEQELFDIMYEASGDGILETKELEKWCKKHYSKFLKLFEKLKNEKIKELKEQNHIYKRTSKEECKCKEVMDDTIYKDSIELYGLKLFLEEFSRIDTKEVLEVNIWDEYLMFAYLFGMADKVAKQLKNLYPEVMEQSNFDYDTVIFVNNLSSNSVSAASSARAAAQSYSGGGGGFSSGGGGGGSFGGGGSMGGR